MGGIKRCIECGRAHTRKDVDYCYDCGRERMLEEIRQMQEKKGAYYRKWKMRWEAATGLKLRGGE